MPKKSRKEKIIADQKRKRPTSIPSTTSIATVSAAQQPPTFQFHLTKKTDTGILPKIPSDNTELVAIKQDLVKTLLLAFIAVSIEFALYWFGRGKI